MEYGIWKDEERLKTTSIRPQVGSDVPADRLECGPLAHSDLPPPILVCRSAKK